MTVLSTRGLIKEYVLGGRSVTAVDHIDLMVERGSLVTIVGRSGSGKTTLLKLIAGLVAPTAGEISVQPPEARIGVMFQEPRLMPWLTVKQNMALALLKERDKSKVEAVVQYYLNLLGLIEFQHAYPAQISGGMAQRAALGRALCFNPEVILMDEPLSALDAFTRKRLQQELEVIFRQQQKTVLFVTHDVDEAILLGQRVVVMDSGRIVKEYKIPFAYPRDGRTRGFYELREQVLDSIRGTGG